MQRITRAAILQQGSMGQQQVINLIKVGAESEEHLCRDAEVEKRLMDHLSIGRERKVHLIARPRHHRTPGRVAPHRRRARGLARLALACSSAGR